MLKIKEDRFYEILDKYEENGCDVPEDKDYPSIDEIRTDRRQRILLITSFSSASIHLKELPDSTMTKAILRHCVLLITF